MPDVFSDDVASLIINPHMKEYGFIEIVKTSFRIAFQLCMGFLFLVTYHHLNSEFLDAQSVLTISAITCSFGYLLHKFHQRETESFGIWSLIPKDHIRVTVIYILFSYQLAPVLRTLTATVSTDTIHATAICMLCVHLLTCNYGINGFFRSRTVSVNAAVIGSLCLASRMRTDLESLALLTCAVICFVLFPLFAPIIWNSALFLSLLIIFVAKGCYLVNSSLFLIFAVIMFTVITVLPVLFIVSCRFKQNKYGPWDEAVPGN